MISSPSTGRHMATHLLDERLTCLCNHNDFLPLDRYQTITPSPSLPSPPLPLLPIQPFIFSPLFFVPSSSSPLYPFLSPSINLCLYFSYLFLFTFLRFHLFHFCPPRPFLFSFSQSSSSFPSCPFFSSMFLSLFHSLLVTLSLILVFFLFSIYFSSLILSPFL